MKSLFRAGLLATTLLCAMQAQAAAFHFSYTFDDNTAVTGTLDGTADGDYVKNLSNIHLFVNNTEVTGPLFSAGYDAATHDYTGAAILSTKAELNNFVFGDLDLASTNNYFTFVNDMTYGQQVFVNAQSVAAPAFDAPANGSWALTTDVPEPASLALTLGALGVMGAVRRRRA